MVDQRAGGTPRFTVVIPTDRPDVREELAEELSGEGVRVILERRREERRPRADAGEVDTGQLALPLGAPGSRLMYVVSREAHEQFQLVERHFADAPGIQVMYDRRHRDRRALAGSVPAGAGERRLVDRRRNDTDHDLRAIGWALVRLEATA